MVRGGRGPSVHVVGAPTDELAQHRGRRYVAVVHRLDLLQQLCQATRAVQGIDPSPGARELLAALGGSKDGSLTFGSLLRGGGNGAGCRLSVSGPAL